MRRAVIAAAAVVASLGAGLGAIGPAAPRFASSLERRLLADARSAAVAIEITPAPGAAAVGLVARGPQAAVLEFAERIETRPPAMRLRSWAMLPDRAGVRLVAVAVAVR